MNTQEENAPTLKTLKVPDFCLPLPEELDKRMMLVAQIIKAMYKDVPPIDDIKTITQIVGIAYHFAISDSQGTAEIKDSFKDDMLNWFANSKECYALLTTLSALSVIKLNVDELNNNNLKRMNEKTKPPKRKLKLVDQWGN